MNGMIRLETPRAHRQVRWQSSVVRSFGTLIAKRNLERGLSAQMLEVVKLYKLQSEDY